MEKLKVLDLFSGIGGFSLGLERTGGFETVAFCEIDPFCQKVLKKHWPDVPIYNDVRTLEYDGAVDVITGGFPCQPFSTAGRRKGAADDRHLWPAMFSLIKKHRPTWVIGENVAGHISMGLDNVLSDLGSAFYAARTFVIPAVAVDAKHRRDRTWIVGYAEHDGRSSPAFARSIIEASYDHQEGSQQAFEFAGASGREHDETLADTESDCSGGLPCGKAEKQSRSSLCGKDVANAAGIGQSGQGESFIWCSSASAREGEADIAIPEREFRKWPTEPSVGRVANGVSNRVDRLKSLGNTVVPQIPEMIGHAILATRSVKS